MATSCPRHSAHTCSGQRKPPALLSSDRRKQPGQGLEGRSHLRYVAVMVVSLALASQGVAQAPLRRIGGGVPRAGGPPGGGGGGAHATRRAAALVGGVS